MDMEERAKRITQDKANLDQEELNAAAEAQRLLLIQARDFAGIMVKHGVPIETIGYYEKRERPFLSNVYRWHEVLRGWCVGHGKNCPLFVVAKDGLPFEAQTAFSVSIDSTDRLHRGHPKDVERLSEMSSWPIIRQPLRVDDPPNHRYWRNWPTGMRFQVGQEPAMSQVSAWKFQLVEEFAHAVAERI